MLGASIERSHSTSRLNPIASSFVPRRCPVSTEGEPERSSPDHTFVKLSPLSPSFFMFLPPPSPPADVTVPALPVGLTAPPSLFDPNCIPGPNHKAKSARAVPCRTTAPTPPSPDPRPISPPSDNHESYPEALRSFLIRAFEQCKNQDDEAEMTTSLLTLIDLFSEEGTLFTIDWDSMPIPPIPSTFDLAQTATATSTHTPAPAPATKIKSKPATKEAWSRSSYNRRRKPSSKPLTQQHSDPHNPISFADCPTKPFSSLPYPIHSSPKSDPPPPLTHPTATLFPSTLSRHLSSSIHTPPTTQIPTPLLFPMSSSKGPSKPNSLFTPLSPTLLPHHPN